MLIDSSFDSYDAYASANLIYYKSKKTAYHVLIADLEKDNKQQVAEQVIKFFNKKMDFLFYKIKNKVASDLKINSSDFNINEFKEDYLLNELDNFSDFRDNDALKRRIVYVLACARSALRISIIV